MCWLSQMLILLCIRGQTEDICLLVLGHSILHLWQYWWLHIRAGWYSLKHQYFQVFDKMYVFQLVNFPIYATGIQQFSCCLFFSLLTSAWHPPGLEVIFYFNRGIFHKHQRPTCSSQLSVKEHRLISFPWVLQVTPQWCSQIYLWYRLTF